MINYRNLISFVFIFTLSFLSVNTKKTLVLLDDWHSIDTNSVFWSQIRKMGYELTFKMVNDMSIDFTNYGEYIYDNMIFFAPSVKEITSKSDVTIEKILKFIDDGHDLMIFGSSDAGEFVRNLVNEFGVDFDDYSSQVKDSIYLHLDSKKINSQLLNLKDDEIILSNNIIDVSTIFKPPKGYILYKGIGMDVDPQNKYIFPILKGDKNTYSVSAKTGEVYSNGEHIKLVNGYQARNNKRVVILGSTEICSDKFYYLSMNENDDYKSILDSPNAVFCQDLLNWNFQRTGVLKFTNVKHNNNKGESLDTYRIKDYLEYYIDILEYDYTTDSWKNYVSDDIQLTFLMMNPYYINQMKRLSNNKPTYYVKFRAPEKHGVFKFLVDYHRTGYSYIFSSTKVPLRPFYHNEFPRFLPCAYPYYTAVFVILGSSILFSILFLYGKENK